jgi:hypothetical protein
VTSPIAWLDHSEFERRRTNELLRQFEEKDTVDELGIGTIRDALSDRLFPGTSIIQTRARYFLFLPWMYQRLEDRGVRSDKIERSARDFEIGLIDPLLASDDTAGTIGKVARNALKTLPSAIYWQGLRRWGIRLYPGNRAAYHASLTDGYYRRVSARRSAREESTTISVARNWHLGLPEAPSDFPTVASHSLTREEAKYLEERLKQTNPRSLLAHLVSECSSKGDNESPWGHTEFSSFPEHNKRELAHAKYFSLIMRGASLVYNLELSERKAKPEWVDEYEERLERWQNDVNKELSTLRAWSVPVFWMIIAEENAAVSPVARDFVNRWIDLVVNKPGNGVASPERRRLVINREREMKGALARVDNARSREVWQGASGTRPIDYRWANIARQLVADIHQGLGRGNA